MASLCNMDIVEDLTLRKRYELRYENMIKIRM